MVALHRSNRIVPVEVPFDEKEVSPRNNSSMITLHSVDGEALLFTADAGAPALDRAWDRPSTWTPYSAGE